MKSVLNISATEIKIKFNIFFKNQVVFFYTLLKVHTITHQIQHTPKESKKKLKIQLSRNITHGDKIKTKKKETYSSPIKGKSLSVSHKAYDSTKKKGRLFANTLLYKIKYIANEKKKSKLSIPYHIPGYVLYFKYMIRNSS